MSPSISKYGREWFVCQRVEQSGVVIWVIFQIAILGDHSVHVAGLLQRPFKSSAKRRAFAKIHRVREQFKLWIGALIQLGEFTRHSGGGRATGVVHHDHL